RFQTEGENKVFPETGGARAVLKILEEELRKNDVKVFFNSRVGELLVKQGKVHAVKLGDGKIIPCDSVILATGGITYPSTGSSGDGQKLAEKAGHEITQLIPALAPLCAEQPFVASLEGLSMENIVIRINKSNGKKTIAGPGDIMFTKKGISGPLVLSLSGDVNGLLEKGESVYLELDLYPALSKEELDRALTEEAKKTAGKNMDNVLNKFLPKRLSSTIMFIAGIAEDKKINQLTRDERQRLSSIIKGLRLDIVKDRSPDNAMITRGGVSIKEINPRTMESRKVRGLYFAGEIMDIDADTGGFNLQAAFSTGDLAGSCAAV
ncbi:MAG: aminoacetone oxidase family FAD-binding enzyme, partial [Candidatus Omnitrophica bacterium]|nr:aminoacetone oxidase family FAD-binding enzyme [Candidatus Omnitrophota bacterium]